MNKTKRAQMRIERGNFTLPSPEEVQQTAPNGAFTSMQLAEWGVSWPPTKGWREELWRRYEAAQRGEPVPAGPVIVSAPVDNSPPQTPTPPRLSVVVDMPQQMRGQSTLAVLAKIRALNDFDFMMFMTDVEYRGMQAAVRAFGLLPTDAVTSRNGGPVDPPW